MNNKQRGDKLRKIIKSIRDGTFEYESREEVKINWSKYNQAQINEMADYLENIKNLVDEAKKRIDERSPPEKRGPGRPPIKPEDITKVLLLQAYTNSPNRIAEGFLRLFREKLGISKHFTYKTIERGYDRDKVNEILDEIVQITNESVEGKELTFSFDGTGFSASNKENYANKRQKQRSNKSKKKSKPSIKDAHDDSFPKSEKSNRTFTYSVMGVGVQHKLISGIAITPNHSIGETTMFPEVFEQTYGSHPNMEKALGDGMYGCRWIVDMVFKKHVSTYFLPRSNVTFASRGYSGWFEMLNPLQKDPPNWLGDYHMRSISETVNSMIECRFGARLRKRLDNRKITETKLKLVGHNIRRMGYLEVMEGIALPWN